MENWKYGFRTTRKIYEVSDLGNIRKRRIGSDEPWEAVKPLKLACGYLAINCLPDNSDADGNLAPGASKNIVSMYVHRLVAMAFVGGKTEEKFIVDHIDRNKYNNHYENLRFVTPAENRKNAVNREKLDSYLYPAKDEVIGPINQNDIIRCDCGRAVNWVYMKKHKETKIHKTLMEKYSE